MKHHILSKTVIAIFIFSGLLWTSACNMPLEAVISSQEVVITQPEDGAQLQSGVTIDIQASFSLPGNAIAASLLVNQQPFRRDVFNKPLPSGNIYQPWAPPGPGTYVLQVMLEDVQGSLNPSNSITVYVSGEEITTVTPFPVEEGTTDTPTSTTTHTPAHEEARVTADQNVNCRKGPSSAYNDVGALYQGETAPITGRNPDSTWYYVDLSGSKCWVWGGAVKVIGDAGAKPVVAAPPLPITVTPDVPTDTPIPPPPYSACHDYPDLATCNTDPMGFGTCSWDTGMNKCKP